MRTLLLASAALLACDCPKAPPKPEGCTTQVIQWSDLEKLDYIVVDEPYWTCNQDWCETESPNPPPGKDLDAIYYGLKAWADDLHNKGYMTWLNLSYPEVRWAKSGKIRIPANIDVVSFDYYKWHTGFDYKTMSCPWDGYEHYNFELAASVAGRQRTGMVVQNRQEVIDLATYWACIHHQPYVVVWPGFNCKAEPPYDCW